MLTSFSLFALQTALSLRLMLGESDTSASRCNKWCSECENLLFAVETVKQTNLSWWWLVNHSQLLSLPEREKDGRREEKGRTVSEGWSDSSSSYICRFSQRIAPHNRLGKSSCFNKLHHYTESKRGVDCGIRWFNGQSEREREEASERQEKDRQENV